jgi:hypothetical protein
LWIISKIKKGGIRIKQFEIGKYDREQIGAHLKGVLISTVHAIPIIASASFWYFV